MTDTARPRDDFAPLVALFFLSGASGLIYQVVWFRMLSRAFGVTVYAVTTVLVVFMAGLALGSFAASRVRPRASPLRAYGALELLVGLTGALSTSAMLALPALFHAVLGTFGPESRAVVALRILTSAVVLLPPTALMGATLPILSAHVARSRASIADRAGLLYGANTLGAVLGVLATGFVLISTLGEKRTTAVAVGLNLAIGVASLALSRGARPSDAEAPGPGRGQGTSPPAEASRTILAVAFASGVVALSFEVIWFRILTLLLGNSVYGFSCMLGAYLVGVGVGSVAMSKLAVRVRAPMTVFGVLEVTVAFLSVLSLAAFLVLGLSSDDTRYAYGLLWGGRDFVTLGTSSLLIVLPATLVYGAIFPLAARLVSEPANGARPEVAIGRLYAFNTLGNIVGSPLAGFFLIPAVGTRATFLAMSMVALLIGAYLLVVARTREKEAQKSPRLRATVALLVVACLGVTALMAKSEDPFLRVLRHRVASTTLLAHEEDRGATISLFEDGASSRTLYINGLYVSNTGPGLGEEMVNFPIAFHPDPGPKRILAVGLGVGEVLRYAVDNGHDITVAELQGSVVDLFRRYGKDARKYLESPHARVVLADGRNYLLGTDERYDLILVDGSPPVYASGMVNLYSRDFATLARSHLTDHGLFVVWFPVVCFESDFWMVIRSFTDVFSSVEVYSPASTPNAMIMGSRVEGAFSIPLETVAGRLERFHGHPPLTAVNVLEGMPFSEEELRRRAEGYPPVTDDRPYTEFPLAHFLRGEPYHADNRFLYPARFPAGTHRCSGEDAADCGAMCDAGQVDSCFILGGLALSGKTGPRDPRVAVAAFDRACTGRFYEACDSLAHLLQRGRGAPSDPARAAALLETACDGGVPAACNNLGVAYQAGRGVPRDDAKAFALVQHSCRSGVMMGCFDLGALYEAGVGTDRSLEKAAALYAEACEHEEHAGCDRLLAVLGSSHAEGAFGDERALRDVVEQACRSGYQPACGRKATTAP